jgi:hypothetical protein
MTSVQAAFLIATFHVAGARLSLPSVEENLHDSTAQGLGPEDKLCAVQSLENTGRPVAPSPLSLTLALVPSRSDGEMPHAAAMENGDGPHLAVRLPVEGIRGPVEASGRFSSFPPSQDTNPQAQKSIPVAAASEDCPVMQGIRLEIRQRLSFFQACADAARRRGVPDVRRLYVTWSIAPDGSIRAMQLEGVMDPEMAACLARAGSRRFPFEPGTELTVPVPIVFVR